LRLNQYLSHHGFAPSRRKADHLILAGKVFINGENVRDFSIQVKDSDLVLVRGVFKEISKNQNTPDVIAYFKPKGLLCSHSDPHSKDTIFSKLPKSFSRYKIAGRLDQDSRGLVLLLKDGKWQHQITHPSIGFEKEYIVKIDGLEEWKDQFSKQIIKGIFLDGEWLQFRKIKQMEKNSFKVILTEGKKREIRRVFQYFGYKVSDLCRTRIGNVGLDQLKIQEGEFAEINLQKIFGNDN
jgi:23S rRNA pseudouridine2605 synthase